MNPPKDFDYGSLKTYILYGIKELTGRVDPIIKLRADEENNTKKEYEKKDSNSSSNSKSNSKREKTEPKIKTEEKISKTKSEPQTPKIPTPHIKRQTSDVFPTLWQDILDEILSARECLTDITINRFVEVAEKISGRKMFSPANVQIIENYCRNETESQQDDIQILYEGPITDDFNKIGHYICVSYQGQEDTVYVYDSLYTKTLSERSKKIINLRYQQPYTQIHYVKPKIFQPDSTSCGVFAIAYVTTILFGRNPAQFRFKLLPSGATDRTMLMRKHLAQMLTDERLSLFPEEK